LLVRLGAVVTAIDVRHAEKLGGMVAELEGIGVTVISGKNPDDIIHTFDLVIVSPGIPTDLPFFDLAFKYCVPVWGEVELAYSACDNPVLAITGTNGKTTTTAILGEIMQAHHAGSKVCGNIGTPFCDMALELLDEDDEDAFVVAEVSSFQLETTYTFAPVVTAVLNITEDHLDRHKSMEAYIASKEKIFAKQKKHHFTVLNYDDVVTRGMAERTNARVLYFSRKAELGEGVFVKDGAIYVKWNEIDEKLIDLSEMKMFGHNIENAMAAAGMAICVGVEPATIRGVLRTFVGYPHRIEFVREVDGVEYYNDSKATNVDSAVKAIESMHRPIVLIGGGADKALPFDDWVKAFNGKVKRLIVFGETAVQIIETCKMHGFEHYEQVSGLKEAVDVARSAAESGDCVLLSPACASLDMFKSYEERGDLFKEYVQQL